MNDICERLRKEIAWEQDVGELLEEAAAEIARLRLADAEREAITEASEFYIGTRTGVTLSRLLERLK